MKLRGPIWDDWIDALASDTYMRGESGFYSESSLGIPRYSPFGVLCHIHPSPPPKWKKFYTLTPKRAFSLLTEEEHEYGSFNYILLVNFIDTVSKFHEFKFPFPVIAQYIRHSHHLLSSLELNDD